MHTASAHLRVELILKCAGSRAGVSLPIDGEAELSVGLPAECTPVSPHLRLRFLSLQWRRIAPTSLGAASGAPVPVLPG